MRQSRLMFGRPFGTEPPESLTTGCARGYNRQSLRDQDIGVKPHLTGSFADPRFAGRSRNDLMIESNN